MKFNEFSKEYEKDLKMTKSLYVHFPFCEMKCHYCDFFSFEEGKFSQGAVRSIYEDILAEAKNLSSLVKSKFETVFLGGGTPSLVPADTLRALFSMLPLEKHSEVTIESNPSSIDYAKAVEWKQLGINRVSVGVQALDDERLKWLGRVHDSDKTLSALEALFSAGLENVSIDYILGVPGQTEETITKELGVLLERFPKLKHVSAYLLTLKQKSSYFKELPAEEEQIKHLFKANEVLTAAGFEHYEISNYCRPGFQSQHNENYWLGGGYYPLGPSAHGFLAQSGVRFKNIANLHKYGEMLQSSQLPWEWLETLTPEQKRLEALSLGLRRQEGLKIDDFEEKFEKGFFKKRAAKLEVFEKEKLAFVHEGRLRLSTKGLFLSDEIINYII